MGELFNLNEFSVGTVLLRLLAAAVMGGLIGSERGRHGRAAGLRTHILVCIGAAVTALTAVYLNDVAAYGGDIGRLPAQVISGVGFLGAGMILVRHRSMVTGLTTAAGLWATAAIGIAVGFGFYSGAVIATIICIFSVTALSRLERKQKNTTYVYIELTDPADTESVVALIHKVQTEQVSYNIIPAKSGRRGCIGITCVLSNEAVFERLRESVKCIPSAVIVVSDITV